MPIELKMPALSPTMEEGTLAKWLVKEGDEVKSGDILAEIETDKATMEFEAVDEGKIAKILVPEGTRRREGRRADRDHGRRGRRRVRCGHAAPKADTPPPAPPKAAPQPKADATLQGSSACRSSGRDACRRRSLPPRRSAEGDRIKASPLARRLAAGAEHRPVRHSGQRPRRPDRPRRHRRCCRQGAAPRPAAAAARSGCAVGTGHLVMPGPMEQAIPHEEVKLSNIRKTIARRLTEAKQQVPHIYLTVDIQLDALLKLRGELNTGLDSRNVKLSVNDLLIKALAQALIEVPECNVAFAGDQMLKYNRADISVAVSIPAGLITPIIVGAEQQERLGDLDRDEGARRPRQGRQAPAAAIPGRHRVA